MFEQIKIWIYEKLDISFVVQFIIFVQSISIANFPHNMVFSEMFVE